MHVQYMSLDYMTLAMHTLTIPLLCHFIKNVQMWFWCLNVVQKVQKCAFGGLVLCCLNAIRQHISYCLGQTHKIYAKIKQLLLLSLLTLLEDTQVLTPRCLIAV